MLLKESRHDELSALELDVIEVLKTIYDPEIPVNIYELGLIYDVIASLKGDIQIQMTLTSPNCPVAQSLPAEVAEKASDVGGVETVEVDIVWDPPWDPERMSEAAKLTVGIF